MARKKPPVVPIEYQSELRRIPSADIIPNTYNPNMLTDRATASLREQVARIGHTLKTVLVRRKGTKFEVIDGEQNLDAAQKAGLTEVDCEVADLDDVEAMHQCFQRNRHGKPHRVFLGQMFRQMLGDSSDPSSEKKSVRALARRLKVSDGTVRNSIIYADAYTQNEDRCHADDIHALSVRAVRDLVALETPEQREAWWAAHEARSKTRRGVPPERRAVLEPALREKTTDELTQILLDNLAEGTLRKALNIPTEKRSA